MNNFNKILFLLIAMLTFTYIYNNIYGYRVHTEKFTSNTQNYISTNQNNIANKLQYGDSNDTLISDDNSDTYGPSSLYGINQNSNTDIYDDRGYKWSTTYNNDNVDTLTDIVDNKQLQQNFERTYMLDPSGSVAKYDITYNTISPNCCPAQYAPPFKVTDKDSSNCDYAQKYVANNYSGMNIDDGSGCVCITPDQATYYGSRGGNSTTV
jgi:hypothetical protein